MVELDPFIIDRPYDYGRPSPNEPIRFMPPDTETAWVSIFKAAEALAGATPDWDFQIAEAAIMTAALDGILQLSFEILVVQSLIGDMPITLLRPKAELLLAERIEKARKFAPAKFKYIADQDIIAWTEDTNHARIICSGRLVVLEEVLAFYAKPVLER